MSDPTKVIVYVAPQGTWLPFVDEDGVDDALNLSKPMRLVAERDYAKLAQGYATLRAERDALRKLLRLCARTCDTLDHGPGKDFHAYDEPCPIIPRIDAALAVQP